MFLFTYGTLRKGMYNNYLLENSKFVGTGEVLGDLYVPVGYTYPKAVLSDDPNYPNRFLVECYEIDGELGLQLDRLELSHGYIKSVIEVHVTREEGDVIKVIGFIYHIDPKAHVISSRFRLVDGDFVNFIKTKGTGLY